MNIQDYQWQTVQEGDKVIARPVNPYKHHAPHYDQDGEYSGDLITDEWRRFEFFARQHTYETLNLLAGQTIDGKELELVQFYFLSGAWRDFEKANVTLAFIADLKTCYKIRRKTQPIEDKKEIRYHELKTWPAYFAEIWDGNKGFELRKNDRDYKQFDTILLKEYLPATGYTGRSVEVIITYVLQDVEPFGLKDGFCILSFKITGYNED